MRGFTLSNDLAREVMLARQAGKDHKILAENLVEVGNGEMWDQSLADVVVDKLVGIVDNLKRNEKDVSADTFDGRACEIIHSGLDLPPNLIASDGFWRWLAVEKFERVIEERMGSPAHLGNYGVDKQVTYNRIAILWYKANAVYDCESEDPYHLARRPSHTDFWESGIIRPYYGWCHNLARVFFKFQYRDPNSRRQYLHAGKDGLREMYKRLRQLHTTISFEYLTDDQIWQILEEKSADLRKA